MATNPFQRLGILPQQLVDLSHSEIKQLVTERYRFFAKVYHVDVGDAPNAKKFRAVQEAFDELTSSEAALAEWCERQVKPERSDKESGVSRAVEELRTRTEVLNDLWQQVTMPRSRPEEGIVFNLNPFSVPPGRYFMTDVMRSLVHRKWRDNERFDLLDVVRGMHYELSVSPQGEIRRHELGHGNYRRGEETAPLDAVPEWTYETHPHFGVYWRRTGKSHALPGMKLIGALYKELIPIVNARPLEGRNEREAAEADGVDPDLMLANRRYREEQTVRIIENISKEEGEDWTARGAPIGMKEFSPWLRCFRPEIHSLGIVVGVSEQQGELMFHILGCVTSRVAKFVEE